MSGRDWDREVVLARLGAALLAAGVSVTDVRQHLDATAAEALPGAAPTFAVLPAAVFVTRAQTGETRTVIADGPPLSIRQGALVQQLARDIAQGRSSTSAVAPALERITAARQRHPLLATWTGNALIGLSLAVVFRSPWWAVLTSAVVGALVGALLHLTAHLTARLPAAAAVAPFAVAFSSTVLVGAFAHAAGLVPVPLYAVCAPIALMVPGMTITSGLLELTANDILTGASRLVHGLIVLMFMAAGIGAGAAAVDLRFDAGWAVSLTQADVLASATNPWQLLPPSWVCWAAVVLVAVGFGASSDCGPRLTAAFVPVMLTAYLGVLLLEPRLGAPAATGVTAAVLFVGARAVEAVTGEVPASTLFLPAFALLVPGMVGLVALASVHSSGAALTTAAATFAALCIGMKTGELLAAPLPALTTL